MTDIVGIPFADTSVGDLTFSLQQERLAPVCGTTVVLSPEETLELNVLGCSHQVILVDKGRDLVVETLACLSGVPAALPDTASTRLTGPDAADRSAAIHHRFESSTRSLDDADFQRAVRRITDDAQASRHSAVARFPGHPGAVTAIVLEPTIDRSIGWTTWHCYPQHGEIVRTRSRIHRTRVEDMNVDEPTELTV